MDVMTQRRRAASYRCVRMETGWRDPLDALSRAGGPSTFGLSATQLRGEVDRCRAAGWEHWELRVRFVDPREVISC